MKKIRFSIIVLTIFLLPLTFRSTTHAQSGLFAKSYTNTYFLPGRPFYFLKELSELIARNASGNDVARLNVELRFLNENFDALNFLDARHQNDQSGFQEALSQYTKNADRLFSILKFFKNSYSQDVKSSFESLIFSVVKNNIALNNIGNKYPGDIHLKISAVNDKLEEAIGFIPEKIGDAGKLKELLGDISEKYSLSGDDINILYFLDILKSRPMDEASQMAILVAEENAVNSIGARILSDSNYISNFDQFSDFWSLRLISEVIGFNDDAYLDTIFRNARKNIIDKIGSNISIDTVRNALIKSARLISENRGYSSEFYYASAVLELANQLYFENKYADAYGKAIEAEATLEAFKANQFSK